MLLRFVRIGRVPAAVLLAASFWLLAFPAVLRAQPAPPGDAPAEFAVGETFDGRPFVYRVQSQSQKPGFRILRLTYPSPVATGVPQNNVVPAEYYLPDGIAPGGPPRPAVISMHILDGNMELVRMTCSVLASHGVPAILFKLPYYGERGLPQGPEAMARDPKLLVSGIRQAMADVRRTVDLLASRPEIDKRRIGITGISLGGIVAATAAEHEPRLWRAMLVMAGGDLLPIIHHARETRPLSRTLRGLPEGERRAVEEAIAAVDPLAQAARLRAAAAAGRVLMVNAGADNVIPRACSQRLAAALGIGPRVVWLEGLDHYTAMAALPRVLATMADFFAQDLPPGARPPQRPAGPRSAPQAALDLLAEAASFWSVEPAAGRCHLADLEFSAVTPQQQRFDGRVLLLRGSDWRFKLECRLPGIAELLAGQGEHPWMVSPDKTLLLGVAPSKPRGDMLALADRRRVAMLDMLCGAVAAARMAPDAVESLAAIFDEAPRDGQRVIRVDVKQGLPAVLRLLLDADGRTPQRLAFNVPGASGLVTFRQWQLNAPAPDALFEPPRGLAEKKVDPAELKQLFAAMFNLAMGGLQ